MKTESLKNDVRIRERKKEDMKRMNRFLNFSRDS
jgi:hypothetical protein